jgi:hypothetical protein
MDWLTEGHHRNKPVIVGWEDRGLTDTLTLLKFLNKLWRMDMPDRSIHYTTRLRQKRTEPHTCNIYILFY